MGTSEEFENPPDAPPPSREAILVLDAAVGASLLAAATALTVGRRVRRAFRPVAVVVLRPPMLTERYHAGTWLDGLARRGGEGRDEVERQVSMALDRIVPTVVDAVVRRIDLAGLAEGVIAEVDLAELIRQSTGSVASDTVRGVRMQGISGDEAVGRAVGRLRVRFGRKAPPEPPPESTPADSPVAETDDSPSPGPDVPPVAPEPELSPTQR